jgi:polar amino acid transport system substrate-binding protein
MTMAGKPISRREAFKMCAATGLVVAGGSTLLSACSSASTPAGDTLSAAQKRGYIRVGFANEAPYGYANANGDLTGEAPTVAGAIMKKLGVPSLQGVLTEFGSLIPGLMANRFDMIAAGMFITSQRCQQILFSNPDYAAAEGLAVKKGNPKGLADYQSIAKNPSVRLGVESGAVEGQYAQQAGVESSQIQQFPDGPTGMEALTSGRIDVFSLTAISLEYLLKTGSYPGLEVVSFFPTANGKTIMTAGGYGFRDSDQALVTKFDQQLAALQKSGELAKMIAPFGFTGPTVTAAYTLTSAELCKSS